MERLRGGAQPGAAARRLSGAGRCAARQSGRRGVLLDPAHRHAAGAQRPGHRTAPPEDSRRGDPRGDDTGLGGGSRRRGRPVRLRRLRTGKPGSACSALTDRGARGRCRVVIGQSRASPRPVQEAGRATTGRTQVCPPSHGGLVATHDSAQHALHPLPPRGRTFLAGFESTYHPGADVDALDVTGHAEHGDDDLEHLLSAGVRHLRFPLRWQRIEPVPGVFDWRETDRALGRLRDRGAVPIVDLVHHTTYPRWLTDGFRGADFGPAFVRYAEAVARRYPWLPAYTLFNEPFATLFLAGHEALWPPYDRGIDGF